MPDETYLTVQEIAKRLKVGEQTVRRWIKKGILPAIDILGVYRISEADFQEFISKYRMKPKE